MPEYITEEELKKAKTDKIIRAAMKADLEKAVGIGKTKEYSIDSPEYGTRLYQRAATEDAILRFSYDLGCYSPLYRDPAYGKCNGYGGLLAPPHFLTAISRFAWAAYRDLNTYRYYIEAYDAGMSGEWFKTIRENDEFSVTETPVEVKDLTREDTALQFLIRSEKVYKNQQNEIVAVISPSIIVRFPRVANELEGLKKRPQKPYFFPPTAMAEWRRLVTQDPIRGKQPRYWEDVKIGALIPPTHNMYVTEEYGAFVRGGGYEVGFCWRLQMEKSKERPNGWKTAVDPESGLPIFASPHLNDYIAKTYGIPRAFAPGPQMVCWACNALLHWMGDTGVLKKVEAQYIRPLWEDSLVLCKGTVTKKYVQRDEHLVDVKFTVEDHHGDLPIPGGTATIVLPSRQLPKEYMEKFNLVVANPK